jgi:hypothetical protein
MVDLKNAYKPRKHNLIFVVEALLSASEVCQSVTTSISSWVKGPQGAAATYISGSERISPRAAIETITSAPRFPKRALQPTNLYKVIKISKLRNARETRYVDA